MKDNCVGAIVGGDFNTQLRVGLRGQMLEDLLHSFAFEVANGQSEMQDADDIWTFRSSTGIKRRIDFVLYSSRLSCFAGHATNDLDLGSDHRAVYTGFRLASSVQGQRRRKQTNKRWKPLQPDDGSPSVYRCALTTRLQSRTPTTLYDLEQIMEQAKNQCDGQQQQSQSETKQPWQHPEIQRLIQQRKQAKANEERTTVSKMLQKENPSIFATETEPKDRTNSDRV